jgi:hypothetical protein
MSPIEDNIPIPKRGGSNRAYKYPFEKMKVGQSFWIAESIYRVAPAACKFGRDNGKKFTCRTMDDGRESGVRVWRIA